MKINKSLKDITFYGKAKDFVPYLFDDQLETIEYYLDEYPLEEGWTESSLNEFFSEEKNQDTIAKLLGYENRSELLYEIIPEDGLNEDESTTHDAKDIVACSVD